MKKTNKIEKIAYIIDSSCFLSEQEVKDLNMFFVPLHCSIEGVDFLEGQDLDKDYLIDALSKRKDVKTSQPSPRECLELIDKLKEEGYTCAIYSSIATGFSGSLNGMVSVGNDENFKIYPLDSKSVGLIQTNSLLKVRRLIEQEDYSIETALDIVSKSLVKAKTLLLAEDLFHLARGGRITSTAAALGSMLKIKPILYTVYKKDGQIDVLEKVRSSKKAMKKMAQIALEDIDVSKYKFAVAHFDGLENARFVKNEMLKIAPSINIAEYELNSIIGVHTGLGVVGIQVWPK
jgi:DegV family protein with EDD domain